MGQYITNLTIQCLGAVFQQPEVADIKRIKRKKLLYVELKDENGQRHSAIVSWEFLRNTTEGDTFAVFNIKIADRRWHMYICYHDQAEADTYAVIAVPANPDPCDPCSQPLDPWYEGRPVDEQSSATTPKCTCCGVRSSTVQQAYWGGVPVPQTAICSTCRQHPRGEVTLFKESALSLVA